MRVLKYSFLFSLSLGIAACNTTIYPEGGDLYSSVTTSSRQYGAERNAEKDTEKYCQKMGKRLVIIKHETQYHGSSTNNKVVGALVGGVIGIPNPAVSDSDYEVKTRFRCE